MIILLIGVRSIDHKQDKYSEYSLAFDSPKAESHGKALSDRQGILKLTHSRKAPIYCNLSPRLADKSSI